MGIRKIIDWAIQSASSSMQGTIASQFYQYFDTVGNWVWACDVDIGDPNNVLRCVAVAANNRDIIYAEIGKGVQLSKVGNGKWVITGLSKTVNSTIHYIFVSFDEDIFSISRRELRGWIIRPLTYGELGSIYSPLGYGLLPYGAVGRFKAEDGSFASLVEEI